MSAFDEYMKRSQREVIPGSIGSYLAQKNSVGRIVEPVASDVPVMTLGANGITDWFSQNWKWLALGGLAVFALASK